MIGRDGELASVERYASETAEIMEQTGQGELRPAVLVLEALVDALAGRMEAARAKAAVEGYLSSATPDGGPPVVTGSGYYKNQAACGAGICNNDVVTVSDTTFRMDRATADGGGFYNDDGSTITLTNSSVTENHPDSCGPIGSITGRTG